MRYADGHKDETRSRIVDAAGRLFRAEGYAATGVARLMGAASLTVGGFSGHFASKEDLLGDVLAVSFERIRTILLAGLEETRGAEFVREVSRRYLSRVHRDHPEEGCAAPSLAAEIGRQSEETREVFEQHLVALLDLLEPHLEGSKEFASGARSEAEPSGDRRPDSRRQAVASRRGQDVREAGLRPGPGDIPRRERAIGLASSMVGGLLLSRAVKSKKLSDEILLACRHYAASKED